jgi:glutamyl-tRNA synthetase
MVRQLMKGDRALFVEATKVRVRFAPSPTGYLHVGGARTALFNWLFARHYGGTFILRIEDTDQARSSEEHVRAILDGLAWLGLDWDEGPFFQSQSVARHRDDALRLLEEGKAYVCFCPPEQLEAKRQQAQAAKVPYKYDRTCLKLAPSERSRRLAAGEPYCVRFRVPEGDTSYDDAVHREVTVSNAQIEDFVLLRSDRTPTYMLSVVSDDVALRITHIIRGDDHISNTPKQILLYRALGQEPPRFAHLPLLLGEDKKKLSKRHGAVAVGDYRERGILPQAMVNFLALLGWSPDDGQEILSRDELIRRFSLEGVGNRGAVFDHQKLEWMNSQYLSRMSADELWPDVERELRRRGLWREEFGGERREWLRRWVDLMKTRARLVGDFAEDGRPYLTDDVDYSSALASKHLRDPEAAGRLEALAAVLERIEPFVEPGIEPALRGAAERLGVPAAKLIHPARLAVTGKEVGPSLFEILALLGREVTVRRLRALAALLRSRPAVSA